MTITHEFKKEEIKELVRAEVVRHNENMLSNKWACPVCGDEYAKVGTLTNHIMKKDGRDEYYTLFIEETLANEVHRRDKEEARKVMSHIQYYHKLVFTESVRNLKKMEEEREELTTKLSKDFSYQLGWIGENIILLEERIKLTKELITFLELAPSLDELLEELNKWKADMTKRILTSFPRHNSTNEFTNIIERVQTQARAEFVSSKFSMSGLEAIIHMIKDLMKEVEKL